MDIQKSFTFQFDDKEWISKLGLGALIVLVPVLNFAWMGYTVQVLRNVMAGVDQPLPEWDELEKKFIDGLILFAAGLVYVLPVLIPLGIPVVMWISSGVLSANRDLQDFAGFLAGAGGMVFVALLCFFMVYMLALSLIRPALMVNFAREGTFASCFKLGQMVKMMTGHSGPYFTAWGASIIAGIVVGMLVGLLNMTVGWIPCIGWAASLVLGFGVGVYLGTLSAHLFGQLGRLTETSAITVQPG